MTRELKKNAISLASNIVIGVASTAPAYSLAAALPGLVAAAKFGVPSVLIVAFIPMLFIATAYYHLNRAAPDCGTTFAWTTRALGPYAGWMGGWAIIATDILVMPGLAQIAGQYTFLLFDISQPSVIATTTVGVVWIATMTAICYVGVALSATTQKFLLGAEVVILIIFAVVGLIKAYAGVLPGSHPISLSWFNPFSDHDGAGFMPALLAAVFIYWGWDTGASMNEETENPRTAPGQAAIISTLLLVGLYLIVSVAAVALDEPALATYTGNDFLAPLSTAVLGPGIGKLMIFAVLTSAAASTQTTILPTARTVISMARAGALPQKFAEIHPRYLTPGFATIAMGVVSTVWYLGLVFVSNNDVITDSITATAIGIAFYYGLTGFSCVALYRRELFKSVRNFVFLGAIPALGGLIMMALFIGSCITYSNPDQGKTSVFGLGAAVIFAIGALLLGVLGMAIARIGLPDFFKRHSRLAEPQIVSR